MSRTRSRTAQGVVIAALTILAAMTLLPFVMTLLMSQKTNAEILTQFWALPRVFRPDYYIEAFSAIWQYMLNSVIVGAFAVLGVAWLSSLSGYVFARLDFGGKRTLFILILGLMMIPGIMTLIPAFLWYKEFPLVGGNDWFGAGGTGFLNTRWVLIIPYITGGQVFGIFLSRTFFESLPEALFEASRIDGASEWRTYLHIGLPLSLPIIVTLAIMNFTAVYNDYIWPLVTVSDKAIQTFSVGVTQFGAEANLEQGQTMAGFVIGSIPLIIAFAFGMKYYIQGLTQGAVKG
ncbi:MAG: carbohydrate ABC transporter permease [Verrucomicrobia bacterium]|jgi:multiple sugar transport system permease protein|nr:carbohydrate ABC transporter permease [Verrucomicrobiota bacterium]MBT7065698.1 carbohydrate ABC transporter permease [Verrucomicrobiota bacterium]MBT7702279.1 carbohydrate ABC transporter permease [Verrucomicrobiota bacterium]